MSNTIYSKMAKSLGTRCRCEVCKRTVTVDPARCLQRGWPNRSIDIKLNRQTNDKKASRFRQAQAENEARPLREALEAWALL